VVEYLEPCYVSYKPVKLWDVKGEISEEYDVEAVEKRGIDWGQKVLQILISTLECQFGESREDNACGSRQKSAWWAAARSRGTESKIKGFESGHHCQGSGHRVGWKVPRTRKVFKGECDEVIGG